MITKPRYQLLLVCLFWAPIAPLKALETLSISFYSETLDLVYDPASILDQEVRVEEHRLTQYYQQLKKTNYQPLLRQLLERREKMDLNDWLYFELLHKALDQLFPPAHTAPRDLTAWFLLAESGFDVRLTYLQDRVYLYAYTKEELYEAPLIEDNGKTFVSLSAMLGAKNENLSLYLLNFVPNPTGRPFSFKLQRLPKLPALVVEKSYEISFKDKVYQLAFQSDQTIIQLMKRYPLIAEDEYFNVPLSTTARQSLLPQLQKILDGMQPKEAVEFLVSFTRSSFPYKEDKLHFGYSKPMIPEEVFHYPFSDCEDRSALFYTLTKELLNLPMIVVAFQDHLTVGVALPDMDGQPIAHHGRKYYICDPTGPANSSQIGRFPKGYETKPFDIIKINIDNQ